MRRHAAPGGATGLPPWRVTPGPKRHHTAGKITARLAAPISALAGGKREERVRLSGLRVLLEPLDDQAPGVVDAAQVILGDASRPVAVTEGDAGLAVLGGGDVPAHCRIAPVREVGEPGPFDALAGNQLVDPHPLGRTAKTEVRDRADFRLGLALRRPEGREPLGRGDRLVDGVGSRLDVDLVHEWSGHASILLKERLN